MRNWVFIIMVMLSVVPLVASADQQKQIELSCKWREQTHYLSVGILEKRSGARIKTITEIERKYAGGLVEDAIVERANNIYRERRLSQLDDNCNSSDSIKLEDLLKYGLHTSLPDSDIQIGSKWKGQTSLNIGENYVPLNVSYTLEKYEKMLGREVFVISFMLNGIEYDETQKMRWAGIGEEAWDVKEGKPLIKIFEIKRGESFVDNVDLKISYSESILF